MPKCRPLTEAGRAAAEDTARDNAIRESIVLGLMRTGKTVDALARETGISRTRLYERRRNPGDFTLDELRRIFRALKMEVMA